MVRFEESTCLQVAVGLIYSLDARELLIAKRPKHALMGGLWEFPGGKLEAGETISQALTREIYEEINIHVKQYHPFLEIKHTYSKRLIHLHVYKITAFDGNPIGKEGQEVRWVALDELRNFTFPEANQIILDRL